MRRGILSSILVTFAVIALTACAGLPTGGAVQEGLPAGSDDGPPDISFRPTGPQPGATPEQIVDGFLLAGSGPAATGGSEWSTAREFLGASFRDQWNPSAQVTVDILADREPVLIDDDTVEVTVTPVATVDEKGVYERADVGTIPLTFELGKNGAGEWRITQAPDGIVLDRTTFAQVFRPYPLAYFDVTWTYLVPDVRWFPQTNTASRIADALVNKPRSDWLAGATKTAFTEGVTSQIGVPVVSGVAGVTLENALGLDQTTLDRMQAQLEASLGAAGVSEVEMLADNTVLPAQAAPTRRTTVTGPALARIEQGFGFLTGDELTEIPGLSDAVEQVDAAAIQVGVDRDSAAVRTADGAVIRVTAEGDAAVLDARSGLVDPSIDPSGVIWSVPRDAPQAVRAYLPGSTEPVQIEAAWPGASRITAMAVSRDGARIAALVSSGGRTSVWGAGIIHDQEQVPRSLSAPIELGIADGAGVGLAWLDDTTVGVLAVGESTVRVLEQLVGGPGVVTPGPEGAASISGANSISSVRLRGADGTLYIKRGANWQQSASGILVLATQQGTPE
ncbi:LpqB family beta-propeller domain-containing protein [Microbacterium aoyamense]|uniref:LpqB family beta-propeller domain-containing protein n=1 Tax=Microbacterium aoyamense TaxID=344166 RepID=A0ABP5AYY6_9MICO|nr:LpqB family beta-propeller domain-containing protein [Microbacterium aoyamense]